jgi:hypothetical protein
MKRLLKLAGLLVLVFGGGGFALWSYTEGDDDHRTMEIAADAVIDAANAAANWASDRSTYEVSVVNMMGESRGGGLAGQIVIESRLTVTGGAHLSRLCKALPRVHDAINAVLADGVGRALRANARLTADSFSDHADAVRDRLNRQIAGGAVSGAQVVVRNARDVQEQGCTDAKVQQAEPAKN